MSAPPEITTTAPRTLAVTRFHVDADAMDAMAGNMGSAFGTVMEYLGRLGEAPSGPAVACYEPQGTGYDVWAGFTVPQPVTPGDGVETLELPATEVAHAIHQGAYEKLPATYEALHTYAAARGVALADDAMMWEEYWSGPDEPTEETRTDVYWPVAS